MIDISGGKYTLSKLNELIPEKYKDRQIVSVTQNGIATPVDQTTEGSTKYEGVTNFVLSGWRTNHSRQTEDVLTWLKDDLSWSVVEYIET